MWIKLRVKNSLHIISIMIINWKLTRLRGSTGFQILRRRIKQAGQRVTGGNTWKLGHTHR